MPLEIPNLDDMTYQEILNNALARIRVHNPEWTNLGESDPGVTILELFAFMTESLLYRSNQIPERNRKKFLKLLGIPMQPAAASRGIVTFQNERGPLQSFTMPADLEVRAGQIPFHTSGVIDVLPVEARVYYKQIVAMTDPGARDAYAKLYGSRAAAEELLFYHTTPLETPTDPARMPIVDLGTDTVDGAMWIALLARPKERREDARAAIGNHVLHLGILPGFKSPEIDLPPVGSQRTDRQSPLLFEAISYDADSKKPVSLPLRSNAYVNVLLEPGVVSIQLPAAEKLILWQTPETFEPADIGLPPQMEDDEERVITWIRMRLPAEEQFRKAKISWMGVNAVMVRQRAQVTGEALGKGSGEPDQTYTLVHKPVLPGAVTMKVAGKPWHETDDLHTAGPEIPVRDSSLPPGSYPVDHRSPNVFTVNNESGEIRFGDGARGARPHIGAEIVVAYAYGGGKAGNVGGGAINKSPTLPAGVKLNNALPTWCGDEPESVSEAERNIARYLRHRDRLVTQEDFRDVVLRTPGVDMGRVEVLPTYHPYLSSQMAAPGVVTVVTIPNQLKGNDVPPEPNRPFLDVVSRYVDERRLITTEVFVTGPSYKRIQLAVWVEVFHDRDFPQVREAVNQALKRYLSPLEGGRNAQGWPLGKVIDVHELRSVVVHVEGVLEVTSIALFDEDGPVLSPIPLDPLELPWLMKVDAYRGQPPSVIALLPATGSKKALPVPVIPAEC